MHAKVMYAASRRGLLTKGMMNIAVAADIDDNRRVITTNGYSLGDDRGRIRRRQGD